MTLETFFEKFDQLTDTPKEIATIRQLVLDLALSGHAVGLDSGNWERVKLGSLGEWGSGGTPLRSEPNYYGGSIPWLVIGDLNDGVVTSASTYISEAGLANSSARLLPKNVLLIAMYGSIGKLGVTGIECATNQAIAFCNPDSERVDLTYFFYAMKAIRPSLLARGQGLAQKNISQTILKDWEIALPSLTEQKGIVAKVDELMALCDRLEAQLRERETRHAALARASLARFGGAPTPANLEFLFHRSYSISPADLRKSILTLAVRGKLVAQDPTEEGADKLLGRIDQLRSSLLEEGYPNREEASTQLRKQRAQGLPKGLAPLPLGWKWTTLIHASLVVVDCHNKTAPYVESGIRLLRTTNIRMGQLNFLEPKFVDDSTYERWSARCKPAPGDILITREAPMGEVCIIPEGMKICLGQRMMLVRLVPDTMEPKFVLYSLMAPDLMDRVQDKPVGATVQHFRVGGVETLLTPVPPRAEQRRIVAKVDQLMALVDQLESQLSGSRAASTKLLDAVVAELTA